MLFNFKPKKLFQLSLLIRKRKKWTNLNKYHFHYFHFNLSIINIKEKITRTEFQRLKFSLDRYSIPNPKKLFQLLVLIRKVERKQNGRKFGDRLERGDELKI